MKQEAISLAHTLLANRPRGARFTAQELYGPHWEAVTEGKPKVFGDHFAQAVASGLIVGIAFVQVLRSGRKNQWIKL